MGTWGRGTFDDDTACDWLDELQVAGDLISFLKNSITGSPIDEYLEYDSCIAILGAAEIIAGVLAGPRSDLHEDALEIIHQLDSDTVRPLARLAAEGVSRVLQKNSELDELWSENEEEYPLWRTSLEELERRLSG
jgi:hypothetical protein